MSDVVYEVVESKELSQPQVIALGNFLSALFGVPISSLQGLSIVREQDLENGGFKVVASARVYKEATAEQVLDEIEAGRVSRIVRRKRA